MGATDVFEHVRGENLSREEMSRVTELDVRAIIEQARAYDVPIVLVLYPVGLGWFFEANAGIRAAAAATETPLVESAEAAGRLKEEFRRRGVKTTNATFYDKSIHPRPVFYDAIADLILERIDANGLLGERSSPHLEAEAPERSRSSARAAGEPGNSASR
jgi:hypothetical protein